MRTASIDLAMEAITLSLFHQASLLQTDSLYLPVFLFHQDLLRRQDLVENRDSVVKPIKTRDLDLVAAMSNKAVSKMVNRAVNLEMDKNLMDRELIDKDPMDKVLLVESPVVNNKDKEITLFVAKPMVIHTKTTKMDYKLLDSNLEMGLKVSDSNLEMGLKVSDNNLATAHKALANNLKKDHKALDSNLKTDHKVLDNASAVNPMFLDKQTINSVDNNNRDQLKTLQISILKAANNPNLAKTRKTSTTLAVTHKIKVDLEET
jgi:hypothetical protein